MESIKLENQFTKRFGNDQAHDVLKHFLNSLLYLRGEHVSKSRFCESNEAINDITPAIKYATYFPSVC